MKKKESKSYPKPIGFQESNFTYTKPVNWDEDKGDCGDLPVFKSDGQIISCWGLGFWGRIKAMLTGKVWLIVTSTVQPPISIMVDKPLYQPRLVTDKEILKVLPKVQDLPLNRAYNEVLSMLKTDTWFLTLERFTKLISQYNESKK